MADDLGVAARADALFLSFQAALAGRYSLERELGRGGMGVVYLAHEVRLDRPVAIKLLPPELAARGALRERFLREARTAAKLGHPNIVPIYAVDDVEHFVFYAMAYVEGETVAHRVATRGALPSHEAARILREVALALAYAHEKGVVHRDVKPENVLLEAGSGRALVADFGIARVAHDSGGTGIGEVLGTPHFMSPEQASAETVDGRSDLYSLGVVGYYMLSGRLPFDGPNAAAIMSQHLTTPAPALSSVAQAVPARLARVVSQCMAKDPGARFPDGKTLAEAIGLEERKELPAALQEFLAESETRSGLRVFSTVLLVGLLADFLYYLGVSYAIFRSGRTELPTRGAVIDVVIVPLAIMVSLRVTVRRLRRLREAGYRRDDLVRTLAADTKRRGQVARVGRGFDLAYRDPELIHRLWVGVVGLFAVLALGTTVTRALGLNTPIAAWGSNTRLAGLASELYLALLALSAAAAILGARVGWLSGVLSGAPERFWKGAIGRVLFQLAGLGRRPPTLPEAASNRPTELALGLAVEALFHALPKDTRRALNELPDVVHRLEEHAQRIRERVEELERLLADAGQAAGVVVGKQRRETLIADLRAMRDAAQQRFVAVVAGLETIRIGLLRLRAGAGTVEGITADLTTAQGIGEQTARLLQAAGDIQGLLVQESDRL